MIQGVINFTYNTHISKILEITLYNNDELIKTIEDIQKFQDNKQAAFMKGSNLDDKLYK